MSFTDRPPLLRPEALVVAQPSHRFAHGLSTQAHSHRATGFRAGDETRLRQHVQVLHYCRQLYIEWLGQLADGLAVLPLQMPQNGPASGIHQGRECTVEPFVIVHHIGKYPSTTARCQSQCGIVPFRTVGHAPCPYCSAHVYNCYPE